MSDAQTIVSALLSQLQDDLDRAWDVPALVRVSGYSEAQLHRAFTSITGEPPMRYVRRLRLERAAHFFEEFPELSVTDVALRSGYEGPDAFGRAFRRTIGCSPSEFRSQLPPPTGGGPRRRHAEPLLGRAPADGAPEGLDPSPQLVERGILRGWSVILGARPAPRDMEAALSTLARTGSPPAAFELGALVQAWGWSSQSWRIETRMLRLSDEPAPGRLVPWHTRGRTWAEFAYEGPPMGVAAACQWAVEHWAPASGLRVPFAPVISLLDAPLSEAQRARILCPVTTLRAVTLGSGA